MAPTHPPARAAGPFLCAALLGAALLPAQSGTTVSPAGYASVEAAGNTTLPWQSGPFFQPTRWLAIHSDVAGTPRVITALAFRRDGNAPPQNATRSVDVEIRAGASVPYDAPSWVFSRNWTAPPTVVLPRQVVQLGPFAAAGSPAPFEMRFLLTTPLLWLGQGSLAYEASIYGNTSAGLTSALDAVVVNGVGGFPGLPVGQGCLVAGQTGPMTLTITHGAIGSIYMFGAVVRDAPANAPTVLAFGVRNPGLAVPGLCTSLYTDLVATFDLGLSDAAGVHAETLSAGGTTFYLPAGPSCLALPNTFGNGEYYVQAHALDPQSTWPIQVASSNGLRVFVPPAGGAAPSKVTTLFTIDPSPAHPSALFMSSNIGFSLVTEFRW